MLKLDSVTAGYGATTVLRSVDLSVSDGEVVALLGPNGAGKTTLLRTATGFIRPRAGRISIDGEDVTGRPPHIYVSRGVCHLPEGRGIFPSLTVRENFIIQGRSRRVDEAASEAVEMFPALANKMNQTAGSLSGGEQQMLALSRAYITHPKLVMIDEPSIGLGPLVVDRIYEALAQLVKRGLSVVVVEQYIHKALDLANSVYILRGGEIVTADSKELDADEIYHTYLGA